MPHQGFEPTTLGDVAEESLKFQKYLVCKNLERCALFDVLQKHGCFFTEANCLCRYTDQAKRRAFSSVFTCKSTTRLSQELIFLENYNTDSDSKLWKF